MDRQAFREELHKALSEIFLEKIHGYFDQQFEAHRQLVRYISAVDRKYDDSTALREGFSGIFSTINDGLNKEDKEEIAKAYLSGVNQLSELFPEEIVWEQAEERFIIQDKDSLFVSLGKSSKRVGRSVSYGWHKAAALFTQSANGWEPWTQTVPLRRLIQFHFQDSQLVADWIVTLERIQLKIITDVEDLFVNRSRSSKGLRISDFTDSLQEMLETKQSALKQQAVEAVNKMESEIHRKVKKAGTIEWGSGFYDTQRLKSYREGFQQRLQNIEERWRHVQQLLLDQSREVVRFLNLGLDIEQQSQQFIADFESVFDQTLNQPLGELVQLLEKSIQQVGQGDSLKNVREIKDDLSEFVTERLVLPIQKLLDNDVLSRKTEHFFEELLLHVNQVPQQTTLVFDIEFETDPPTVNQKKVEWRQLVVRALRENLINGLQPNQQNYEGFLSDILQEIREIENIIEVNLESALSVQNEDARQQEVEHPAMIAKESLNRILSKIEELRAQAFEKEADTRRIIDEGSENFISSLLTLLHEGDVKELQLLNAKYKVKETTKDWRTVFDSRLARTQDRLMLWSRFGWQKANKLSLSIREFAGFKDQVAIDSRRADIATYLSETDQKIKELPFIYRRLFNFSAEADQRFYIPAPESSITFKRAYEQWKQSFPATFAIVGEKGSGKSSFLHLVQESELQQADVIRINIDNTLWTETALVGNLAEALGVSQAETVQDIIEAVGNLEDRKVVLLECLQSCFVRNINGYEAIEKLCYLISETRSRIFWSVSCSRYAWHFLEKVVQVNEYFSHTTMSDTLDAGQIKNVILNRHRASGYTLIFEPGEETLKSRAYRKLRDQEELAQEYLQKKYFQRLTELAEGNASVAMIFWIRSIRSFDDTYLYIQPLEVKSIEMIEDLSPQVLFALAAFVLQDTLSDEDLAMILNMSEEESRLLINRLRARGLLEEKDTFFTLNHLMYRQIVRVLKERNIIHLI